MTLTRLRRINVRPGTMSALYSSGCLLGILNDEHLHCAADASSDRIWTVVLHTRWTRVKVVDAGPRTIHEDSDLALRRDEPFPRSHSAQHSFAKRPVRRSGK